LYNREKMIFNQTQTNNFGDWGGVMIIFLIDFGIVELFCRCMVFIKMSVFISSGKNV